MERRRIDIPSFYFITRQSLPRTLGIYSGLTAIGVGAAFLLSNYLDPSQRKDV